MTRMQPPFNPADIADPLVRRAGHDAPARKQWPLVLAGGASGAAIGWFMPVAPLETIVESIGLSEIIPAMAAPLGATAHMGLAAGMGVSAAAVIALLLGPLNKDENSLKPAAWKKAASKPSVAAHTEEEEIYADDIRFQGDRKMGFPRTSSADRLNDETLSRSTAYGNNKTRNKSGLFHKMKASLSRIPMPRRFDENDMSPIHRVDGEISDFSDLKRLRAGKDQIEMESEEGAALSRGGLNVKQQSPYPSSANEDFDDVRPIAAHAELGEPLPPIEPSAAHADKSDAQKEAELGMAPVKLSAISAADAAEQHCATSNDHFPPLREQMVDLDDLGTRGAFSTSPHSVKAPAPKPQVAAPPETESEESIAAMLQRLKRALGEAELPVANASSEQAEAEQAAREQAVAQQAADEMAAQELAEKERAAKLRAEKEAEDARLIAEEEARVRVAEEKRIAAEREAARKAATEAEQAAEEAARRAAEARKLLASFEEGSGFSQPFELRNAEPNISSSHDALKPTSQIAPREEFQFSPAPSQIPVQTNALPDEMDDALRSALKTLRRMTRGS